MSLARAGGQRLGAQLREAARRAWQGGPVTTADEACWSSRRQVSAQPLPVEEASFSGRHVSCVFVVKQKLPEVTHLHCCSRPHAVVPLHFQAHQICRVETSGEERAAHARFIYQLYKIRARQSSRHRDVSAVMTPLKYGPACGGSC